MTEVTPRPMDTPDLAGLLAKPVRRGPSERHEESVARPEPPLPEPEANRETPAAAVSLPTQERASESRATSTPIESERKLPGSARNRRGRTATTANIDVDRQYLRSMSIYLPRSLHQRLGQRADVDGSTRTALILTAINRTHDTIGSALNPDRDGTASDLFDIPQRAARKEPSVETTIRVTDRQLDAIDNLAAEHRVNRSRLISAALQVYLG